MQVPPELLWGKVSVLHAALPEAPGGLQPDHSSGRGGGGAVVRLPHHHSPFIIAQVSRRSARKHTHSPTTTHTDKRDFLKA